MADAGKAALIDAIEVIRCGSAEHMEESERALIGALCPPWNITHNPMAKRGSLPNGGSAV